MRSARIIIGYDGTAFHGSQAQPRVRTVQSEFQAAIDRIAPGSERCALAGRTDRGVHAYGQVASVNVRWDRSRQELRYSLDAVSPPDLIVRSVEWAQSDFHARFDARSREYRYRIVVCSEPPVLDARYVWWRRSPLDDRLMQRASSLLVGTHSFGTFAGHGWSQTRAPHELVRVIERCEWRRSDCWEASQQRTDYEFRIVANGFLPNMVRNIVSAVVSVGVAAQPIDWISELLSNGDRRAIGDAAPPHGLTLWQVNYDDQKDLSAGERPHWECEVH